MVAYDCVTQGTVSTEVVEYLFACTVCAKDEKEGILVCLEGVSYVPTHICTAEQLVQEKQRSLQTALFCK